MSKQRHRARLRLSPLALAPVALCASLGLLVATGGCARRVIRGRVVGYDGKPLPGATVATEPPTDSRVTTELGAFRIERVLDAQAVSHALPPGTYRLKVSKLGYISQEQDVTLVDGHADVGAVRLKRKAVDVNAPTDVTPNSGDGPTGQDLRGGVHPGD